MFVVLHRVSGLRDKLRRHSNLLLKAVQLNDARVSVQDLDFEALGGTAPLRTPDIALVEGEGVPSTGRLPT